MARAAQLKFRVWDGGVEIVGTVVLEEDAVIVTREQGGTRQEDVLNAGSGYAFWFPATAGLGLLSGLGDADQLTAVTLKSTAADPAQLMEPQLTKVSVRSGSPREIEVMGTSQSLPARIISWEDQLRTVWVDESGWPLMMERGDGLTAVTRRLSSTRNGGAGSE